MQIQEREKREFFLAHIEKQPPTQGLPIGQFKISCPDCQSQRKNKADRPLSVKIESDRLVFHCHHCGERGSVFTNKTINFNNLERSVETAPNIKNIPPNHLSGQAADWLKQRGIDPVIADKAGAILNQKNNKPVIGFPYLTDGNVDAVKWRSANGAKTFWWEGKASRLWGQQIFDPDLPILDGIIITEGELDCLAVQNAFAGHMNIQCYSVPNGAPSKISENRVAPEEEGRFKFVWEERDKFKSQTRIILATDADKCGDLLAAELSRRLNAGRCTRVSYGTHKDANELLMADGSEAVRESIINASPMPLHGLNDISSYHEEFQRLYDQGVPRGISTGYTSVDKLFKLTTSSLVVISGWPSEGKSAWLDSLIINVGRSTGLKTCFCSFEKPPAMHSALLAQVLIGKSFFSDGSGPRMTQSEKDWAVSWIKEHILFQDYRSDELPTIEKILEKAEGAVMRGCRILVIDPFNFIHAKSIDTDFISSVLTKIQLFCRHYDVLCLFVSHPAKPSYRDGKRPLVGGLDVAGSMHWFSKCDVGLTIRKIDDERPEDGNCELIAWKVRWGWCGKTGKVSLIFDPRTGRYSEVQGDIEDEDFDWSL